jgi:hypothetical protein
VRLFLNRVIVVALAATTVVAVFADVESTGNLSMALNGDGIAQLMLLVGLIMAYGRFYFGKKPLGGMTFQDMIKREKVGYGILALLFSLFMVIGKAQEAHSDLKYQYIAVIMFIGYLSLFYMVISFIGRKFDDFNNKNEETQIGRVTRWMFDEHVTLGTSLVMLVLRLPYLVAFYPCSMTWDGGAQISNYYGIEPFTNHHPPLLSFIYGAIAMYSSRWNLPNLGMFMIPVMTTALSMFTVARLFELFKYIKVPYQIRWGSLVYYAAFTVWCIYDVTVIKDSLYYQFTVLLLIQVVYCFSKGEGFFANKGNLVWMFIYGVMLTQIRNNGIFVLIFLLPVVFILIPRKNKASFAGMVIAMFAVIYVLNNVVYPAFGVTNIVAKEDTYCIMFQQTAKYGQDHPEDVTAEERKFLDMMFDYDELVEVYNPQLADWVKNCLKICEANSADHTNSEFEAIKGQYFKIWFAQLLRHPLCYVDTFLQCSYGYYYPEVKPYKEGTGNYEMDRNMFTTGMHKARQIEKLAPLRFILEQISKLEYVPGLGLLYRCGFYTWCVLLAVVYFIVKKRYINIVYAIPALVNILVCLISPVNTCIRYAMPTMCMVPILYALVFAKKQECDVI